MNQADAFVNEVLSSCYLSLLQKVQQIFRCPDPITRLNAHSRLLSKCSDIIRLMRRAFGMAYGFIHPQVKGTSKNCLGWRDRSPIDLSCSYRKNGCVAEIHAFEQVCCGPSPMGGLDAQA